VKRYRVTVDGRTYEVEIDDPRARPMMARVHGQVFRVEVESEGVRGVSAAPAPTPSPAVRPTASSSPDPAAVAGEGQQLLTAPIPGTITKIAVTTGQAVQRGDELLTIEAMKMFNVIRSPWAATVRTVHVTEGKHVTQGELLLILKLS
jgi:biotin carboxyl carrier protein